MRLAPNPWGLYDMLGNAWEWTADWHAVYSPEARADPWVGVAPSKDSGRANRGGSFGHRADGSRVDGRLALDPSFGYPSQGARPVLPGAPEG